MAILTIGAVLVVGLVGASYATSPRSAIRPAGDVRAPIHEIQGGIRVSELVLSFEEGMKRVGLTPQNTNFGSVDLNRPVYVTVTEYRQPFQAGPWSYAAGTVVTVTDAETGFVHFTRVPKILNSPKLGE